MAHSKITSKPIATKASGLLRSKTTGSKVKSVAGSALSQKHRSGVSRKGVSVSARPPKRG